MASWKATAAARFLLPVLALLALLAAAAAEALLGPASAAAWLLARAVVLGCSACASSSDESSPPDAELGSRCSSSSELLSCSAILVCLPVAGQWPQGWLVIIKHNRMLGMVVEGLLTCWWCFARLVCVMQLVHVIIITSCCCC
jgi:hypothetical protein